MSRKMSIKRKYAGTKKALSRGLALIALGYLIATFITQGAGSANEVSSRVIAGVTFLLTSLGLVRVRRRGAGAQALAEGRHQAGRARAPSDPHSSERREIPTAPSCRWAGY